MADNEHEEDSAPYYCITEARCRLCQFALNDDELVVAGMVQLRQLSTATDPRVSFRPSATIAFQANSNFNNNCPLTTKT